MTYDISLEILNELETGKRGDYGANRGLDSRLYLDEAKQISLASRNKYFPYFKIAMSNDRITYTVNKDPNSHITAGSTDETPWPCLGGKKSTPHRAFLELADIRYAREPTIFQSLSFINNLISDRRFDIALTGVFSKLLTLRELESFLTRYKNDLEYFRDYYQAIRSHITLDFKITDSSGSGNVAESDKVFDYLYEDLSPLFQEYLVEAYILGVPLIYCMEKDNVNYFNYEDGFFPLHIKYDKGFFLFPNNNTPLGNFENKQVLRLSNNDYNNGNLKSILMSIRNLYEECLEVLNDADDDQPAPNAQPAPNVQSSQAAKKNLQLKDNLIIETDKNGKIEFVLSI